MEGITGPVAAQQRLPEADPGGRVRARVMGPVQERTADLFGVADPPCPHEAAGLLGEQQVAAGIGRFHERDRPDHRHPDRAGVGIDYALFIVTRFRESLRAGATPEEAAVTALRTAGRTVLIAGSTVVIGLLGLLVLRQPLLSGVAIAAATAVAMTLLAALTLLPALLGFTGTRLTRRSRILARHRSRPATAGRSGKIPAAQRWAGMIQRHPVISAALSAGVILALAAPLSA